MAQFMPTDYAKMLAGLDTVIREGGEERVNDVVLEVRGRKPKTLEEFVDECVKKGVWERK